MSHTLTIQHNENTDEYYVILPEELLEKLDWIEGDNISWKPGEGDSFILSKVK
jgi:hypothetical protein